MQRTGWPRLFVASALILGLAACDPYAERSQYSPVFPSNTGGSAGGNSPAPTATPTSNPTAAGALAGDVLLVGTLAEGSCGADAISTLDSPDKVRIGFDCNFDGQAMIGPNGAIVYKRSDVTDELRRFVADTFTRNSSGGADWPTSTESLSNDPILTKLQGCPGGQQIFTLWTMQAGTGELIYACFSQAGGGLDYYDSTDTVRFKGIGRVNAWTAGGYMLVGSAASGLSVRSPDGTLTPVTGLTKADVDIWLYRTNGDSFWVAERFSNSSQARLWSVDSSGVATLVGAYADLPAGLQSANGGVIDGNGVLYEFGNIGVVMRRPVAPEASTIVYDERNAPADANTFSTFPPKTYNKIHISNLITGP